MYMQNPAQDTNIRNQHPTVHTGRNNGNELVQNISEELLEPKNNDPAQTNQPDPDIPPERQKLYDLEQMHAIGVAESLTSILDTVPQLTQLQRIRILQARNWLLLDEGLANFIPQQPQQPQEQPAPRYPMESSEEIKKAFEEEMDRKNGVNPNFIEHEDDKADLDAISQKMSDINSPEGLMKKPEPEPEESALKKLMPHFGKKQPPERKLDEKHQSESMG
jgi:hypothetical protein